MVRNLAQFPITPQEKIALILRLKDRIDKTENQQIGNINSLIMADVVKDIQVIYNITDLTFINLTGS